MIANPLVFYHASECLSIQEATFGWHLFHTLQKDCWLEWLYKVEEFWSGILSTFVQNKQQVFVGIQIWCLQASTYSKSLSFQVAHECKSFTSIDLGWIPVKTCEKHSYHLHGSTIYMEVVQETCLNTKKKLRPIPFALFCFVKVFKPGSFQSEPFAEYLYHHLSCLYHTSSSPHCCILTSRWFRL